MAEKDTSTWDVYDWIDVMDNNGLKRRCPNCGDSDVKYAVHSKAQVGCELSVKCNACGRCDQGNNSGADAERMVRDWHQSRAE